MLILSGEDDPSKVLRPRLLAAGSDLSKVNVITADSYFRQRGTLLTIDSQALQAKISQLKPDLVINDPIQAFLPAGLQMNNRSEMRGVVTPFKSFCAAVNAAGATVCHTNKKSNVAGRQRLSDSSDLWDLSRCVIMLGYSKTDEAVYASVEKDSYARKPMTTLSPSKEQRSRVCAQPLQFTKVGQIETMRTLFFSVPQSLLLQETAQKMLSCLCWKIPNWAACQAHSFRLLC